MFVYTAIEMQILHRFENINYKKIRCVTRMFNTKDKIEIYGCAQYDGYKNDRVIYKKNMCIKKFDFYLYLVYDIVHIQV